MFGIGVRSALLDDLGEDREDLAPVLGGRGTHHDEVEALLAVRLVIARRRHQSARTAVGSPMVE